MTRKKLLVILFVAVVVASAVTILLLDRDKRLTFYLAQLRYDRQRFVECLVENYSRGGDRVKKRVQFVFDRMDPSPVPECLEIARWNDPEMQAASVTLLINGGPEKIAKLLELFDAEPVIQASVTRAIVQAGATMTPSLESAVVMPNRPVQWWAIMTLRNLGPAAGKAAKSLDNLAANDPDLPFRAAATDALGATGEAAAPYIPNILKALEQDDPALRASAARALGMIGASARDVLANLTIALRDDDVIVRENAWTAIRRIQAAVSSPGDRACAIDVSVH